MNAFPRAMPMDITDESREAFAALMTGWFSCPESPGFHPGLCDCKCTEPAGCESLSVAGLAAVTDRHCVPVRGGGEHQEVND